MNQCEWRNKNIKLIISIIMINTDSSRPISIVHTLYPACKIYDTVSLVRKLTWIWIRRSWQAKLPWFARGHYSYVIMGAMASQIISLTIAHSTLFLRCRSKKTSKLSVTGLCAGNSPVSGEFPKEMASNAENVSIWWRHHSWTASNSAQWKLPRNTAHESFRCFGLNHDVTRIK